MTPAATVLRPSEVLRARLALLSARLDAVSREVRTLRKR